MRVLDLVLKAEAFDVMITGEKKNEFRRDSKWIRSRLIDKYNRPRQYDVVKFRRGYRTNAPYFVCTYKGFEISQITQGNRVYSNDLYVNITKNTIIIRLGEIIERYQSDNAFK